jgi:hypothetical protein
MSTVEKPMDLKVSKLSENIIGSEIIKLAAEVNEKIKQGERSIILLLETSIQRFSLFHQN